MPSIKFNRDFLLLAPGVVLRSQFPSELDSQYKTLHLVLPPGKAYLQTPGPAYPVFAAGRIGQVVNHTALSNDVGVSSTTIKDWISALKASFILSELPPFFENIRKRVIKAPKFFFTDTGLACHLLGVDTPQQAARDPLRGHLYENWMIVEILKARLNRGLRPDLYFYRDSHGNEVDLIVREAGRLYPVEIKSARTFTPEFLQGIDSFTQAAGRRAGAGTVFYDGDSAFTVKGIRVLNYLRHGHYDQIIRSAD